MKSVPSLWTMRSSWPAATRSTAAAGIWAVGMWIVALSLPACFIDFSAGSDSTCGNGVMESGEVCDGTDFGGQTCPSALGRDFGSLACTPSCQLDVSGCHDCGNGVIDSGEECDDGNARADDGCSETCGVEAGWTCASEPSVCSPICGDGLIRGAEQCDDGNAVPGDGCSTVCQEESGWVCQGEPSRCEWSCEPNCGLCDLDGDGFQRQDSQLGCPEASYPAEWPTDCDDSDSGIFPDLTQGCDGQEGGHPACAAYQLCDGIDNDCDGLVDEGCPDPTCDADGDGFMRYNPSDGCDPAPAYADCIDTDARFYPGAPDICGDGLVQNCVADTPCDNDQDGDGYNADVDCDDTDPQIHHDATEICDGIDNDCDGLVDEGNPDIHGVPMVDVYCTDDDDGLCGVSPGPGRCICTPFTPTGAIDPGNRTSCGGEDFEAMASPRCVFAPQPSLEECDSLDHDCDGQVDKPSGVGLVETGAPCGPDTGECVAGLVIGCDITQTTLGAFNVHFLCGGGYVGPVAERCNGLDDDCDGSLPGDEIDSDGDGYLACTGCAGETLAPGVVGCDDCAAWDGSRYPTAPEMCNGVDDDCEGGISDDGADQCGPSNTTCCGAIGICVDILTDFNHCGGCSSPCNTMLASLCSGGSCACGTGAPCTSGQQCVGSGTSATCQCNSTSCPSGCCNGTMCVPYASQSDNLCGSSGATCTACPYNRTCANGACLCFGQVNPPGESACGDFVDNDCDGDIDCFDSQCSGDPCGANGMICSGGACVCSGNGGAAQSAESTCDDGHDNDCDGNTDCADPQCAGLDGCPL